MALEDGLDVPTLQSVHEAAPCEAAKLPGRQGTHEPPDTEAVPAAQLVHAPTAIAPVAAELVPAGHGVHEDAPVVTAE